MIFKFLGPIALCLLLTQSFEANAGIIDPSSVLLDDAGATQLETWYGQGDLNWTSIWYGTTGATSASWHTAVDGVANTFSIYDVTYNNNNYLIGGFNSAEWNSTFSYLDDLTDNFIFNLTTNTAHTTEDGEWGTLYSVFNSATHFATFGGSHDLYGGQLTLGAIQGASNVYGSYNGKSSAPKGNIIDGDTLAGAVFTVNALETFTTSSAFQVPEPNTLVIFALGVMGLASRRFKKQS